MGLQFGRVSEWVSAWLCPLSYELHVGWAGAVLGTPDDLSLPFGSACALRPWVPGGGALRREGIQAISSWRSWSSCSIIHCGGFAPQQDTVVHSPMLLLEPRSRPAPGKVYPCRPFQFGNGDCTSAAAPPNGASQARGGGFVPSMGRGDKLDPRHSTPKPSYRATECLRKVTRINAICGN